MKSTRIEPTAHAAPTIPDALRAQARALEATAAAIEASGTAPATDTLIPIAECGLEGATIRRYAGRLGVVRIGRRCYVRRSAVLALADALAIEATPRKATAGNPKADYLALVGGRK